MHNSKYIIVHGIVVLYNPDLKLLDRLYKTLRDQVDSIIFVDNSENIAVKEKVGKFLLSIDNSNITYLDLKRNCGIAYAQNKGIEFAKKNGADFVLLLDQDSALPSNMVSGLVKVYKELVSNGCKVAAVGPSFLDEKTNEIAKIIHYERLSIKKVVPDRSKIFEYAHHIISSGSLIPIKVLDNVGKMKESLFIDMVDIEWCIRAKLYGYNSYVVPNVIMRHSIGDKFVSIGKRKVNIHSDFRNYFIVRNNVYLSLHSKLPLNFKIIQMSKVPLHILFYSYHSKRRFYSLGLLTKAVTDGVFRNMNKGHFRQETDN